MGVFEDLETRFLEQSPVAESYKARQILPPSPSRLRRLGGKLGAKAPISGDKNGWKMVKIWPKWRANGRLKIWSFLAKSSFLRGSSSGQIEVLVKNDQN